MSKPRKVAERPLPDRIIDAAEQLFGEHGVDGVSLRQICSAAKTANNYAVQYHFEGLLGLIRAISKKRMPEIEAHRAQLLMQAKAEAKLADIRTLLEIIHRPLMEHTNSQGERAYARFILAALHSSVAQNVASTDLFESMPIAVHVMELIAELQAHLSPALLSERQRLISLLLLNSVFTRFTQPDNLFSDEALFDNALDMAAVALTAMPSNPS